MGSRGLVLAVVLSTTTACDWVFGLNGTVMIDAAEPDATRVHYPTNVMFVTSMTSSPQSWGSDASGADQICVAAAIAQGLPDAAPGAYVAYLELGGNPPDDRLGSARGWVRTDGTPFADTVDSLVAGTIYYPPSLDETGSPIGSGETVGIGMPSEDCDGYTSNDGETYIRYGEPYYVGGEWQNSSANNSCSQAEHLYCFGITRTNPLVVTKVPGRSAFVSVQTFTPGGGLAGADAVCASDAQLARLSGTFQALLPTSTASAMSRFSLEGPNWVRLDGIPLAANVLAFEEQQWDTALAVSSIGGYIDVTVFGMTSLSQPASSSNVTCDDWADTTSGAIFGESSASDGNAIFINYTNCSSIALYCLEI